MMVRKIRLTYMGFKKFKCCINGIFAIHVCQIKYQNNNNEKKSVRRNFFSSLIKPNSVLTRHFTLFKDSLKFFGLDV